MKGGTTKDRIPAEAFPPGEFLKDELDERFWTQEEFAGIIGRPTALVNQIVLGKRAITPEVAAEIGAALRIDAEYWLNLETAYRLWLVRQRQAAPMLDRISRLAQLRERFAVREMAKRGWISKTSDPDELERELLSFLRLDSLEDVSAPAFAAKQTAYGDPLRPVQEAWLWRVQQIAGSMQIARPYSEEAARLVVDELGHLLLDVDNVQRVPELLARAGIRFLIVEGLPGARIDGVTTWLNEVAPVVALTLRLDRVDNFWFVLRHEIEHVLRGDGHGSPVVDTDTGPGAEASNDKEPDQEKAANEAAAEFLVPQDDILAFLGDLYMSYSEKKVTEYAAKLQVHPGIVVGQIHQHLKVRDILRKHLVKVRHLVTGAAVTDGFGQIQQLG